jgi:plasmid stabilization system protein ParE
MGYKYYFEPKALKEYITALEWYKKRSDAAAANFVKEIDIAVAAICFEPYRYHIGYKQFREISLKKYPFHIIYTIEETKKQVLIFSVFHQKKNPVIKFKKR